MMNKKMIYRVLMVATVMLSFYACKKTPGEGGNGRIKGKVWTQAWNSTFTLKEAEYAGADEWVYIIYGDDISYGDRIRTNYNGEYEFKYLREGKYKIYVYSEDSSLQAASGQIAVVKEVSVKKKSTTEVELITIFK